MLLSKIIMFILQWQLNKLRKKEKTPYLYVEGTGKDYPKYLMYTDDEEIRNEMHDIV